MSQLIDIKDKVVLITGSSKGIGRAIAENFAALGAKVVISSRKAGPCEEVAAGIREQGGQAIAVPCHIGDKAQLQNLVDTTLNEWGQIDVLVCNAATNPVYGPLSELDDGAFDKIMEVNVKGAFWLCNMVLPGMAENGGGKVILLSSIAGLKGNTVIGCYGMSKAAEAAMARNLACEWGPKGINVNAIAPGIVVTDFAKALIDDPERKVQAENVTPMRRLGEVDDIAGVALFLATRASDYVTGQIIVADGGTTIA